jgi:endonuclease G
MAFQYLTDDALEEVRQAAVAASLITDANLDASTVGISPAFVGQSMSGGTNLAKLHTLLVRMNETEKLVNSQVPLEKWLKNAIVLSGETEAELVFRRALEQIESDSLPTEGAAPDVEAAPRTEAGALEIEIDEDDTLSVAFLLRGAIAARSVAKLSVHRHFGGEPSSVAGGEPDWGFGTGWMIGPRLLITNHHVVNARRKDESAASEPDFELQAKSTRAEFDFNQQGATVTEVSVLECIASDPTLDYALLRLDDAAADRLPLRLRTKPLTKLEGSALQQRVNVLQHPNGEPMRLGFRNNFVVTGSDERLSYLTDTAGGSSGSPISDDEWHVAGLHRGWSTIKTGPVQVWGKDIKQENYGTPIGRILADLEARAPDAHAEILAGQAALG